jgi:hypothetical protein
MRVTQAVHGLVTSAPRPGDHGGQSVLLSLTRRFGLAIEGTRLGYQRARHPEGNGHGVETSRHDLTEIREN